MVLLSIVTLHFAKLSVTGEGLQRWPLENTGFAIVMLILRQAQYDTAEASA